MSSHPALPPISAATNPAALRATPSSDDSAPLLASEDGDGALIAPHDATTVVTNDLPASACQHVSDLDWRLVDALKGHAVEVIGNRCAARINPPPSDPAEACLRGWGDDPYDAVCDLARQLEDLWGSRRRKPLVLTPVPPAFRGRRADNDVELEVVR